ncbi:MAG: hypothetical protein RBT65_07680 [Methanolobus sp.]|nr:hypothetical protein [Methanolobus sp.]
MILYYNLKRFETEINVLLSTAVIFILFQLYRLEYISELIAIAALFLYLYILLLFLPNLFKPLFNSIVSSLIICVSFFAILFWYFKIDLLPMGTITDDQMLIFVTLLYVFLTYKIMKSNVSVYQYQRIPQLLVDIESNSKAIFKIRNTSDFHAIDLYVTFEILYPIPPNSISTLKLFIERNYTNTIKSYFSKKDASKYVIRYYLEYVESKNNVGIDLEEEVQNLLDEQAIDKERGLEIIGDELHIIVKYDYKSIDNLDLGKPFYKRFKYNMQPTGTKLIHKSGNPVKL